MDLERLCMNNVGILKTSKMSLNCSRNIRKVRNFTATTSKNVHLQQINVFTVFNLRDVTVTDIKHWHMEI